jgi:DNA-binding PadR family transcriptional regulator
LKALREAGLVTVRSEAQRRIYELDPRGVDEVAEWIADIRRFRVGRLDGLERQLKESKP